MVGPWEEFYRGDLQAVYALWAAPVAFLGYWLLGRPRGREGVEPRAAGFMNLYAPVFAIETMIDPYATGPLLRILGLQDPIATGVMLFFVLLGDFRVYLLLFFVLSPERGVGAAVARAAAWTFVVPILAWSANYALHAYYAPKELPGQTIWILYEIGFVAVISALSTRMLSSALELRRFEVRQYLRALARYVALYYALWAGCDLLIVVGGLDAGWGLRAIPNQLYYAFWLPFAYGSFFSPRYAAARIPTHASR
jgi:hypothetical protein